MGSEGMLWAQRGCCGLRGDVAYSIISFIILLFPSLICGTCFTDQVQRVNTGPRSAVGNVSGYRFVSDCRSRGREFDPGLVPYFHGD